MAIVNYVSKLTGNIRKNLDESIRSGSTGSVHDLRVAMKRLRSLLQMLTGVQTWFEEDDYSRRFRRLFKAAGRVRDMHVAQELVWKWAAASDREVSEYFNFLKEREIFERQRFLAVARPFKMTILNRFSRAVSSHCRVIPQGQFELTAGRSTISALLGVASRKTGKSIPQSDLHNLRIASKDARYSLHVLAVVNDEKDFMKDLDDWLRGLHQSIGLWHDTIIAATRLHTFLSKEAVQPLYSPKSYEALALELQYRQERAYNLFAEVWRDQGGVLEKSVEKLGQYNF